jgi:hypothetical protein
MSHRPAIALSTALVLAAALAAPAGAACIDSIETVANPAFAGQCQGPLTGANAQLAGSIVFAAQSFTLAGTAKDGSGVFAADPGAVTSGMLQFTLPQAGPFVIGLRGANRLGLYLFDGGGSGTASLAFDTLGIARNNGRAPRLSEAALYTPTTAVPEPRSVPLMLAGLAVVAFLARRRG